MRYKLALDFGTTNSLIAICDDEQPTAKIINLPNISLNEAKDHPAIIPSLLYIQNGASGQVVVGQAVRAQGLDRQRDNRLFRNFKRGIATTPASKPRQIDGVAWAERDAGRSFIHHLLQALPYPKTDLAQLVLTAPVEVFELYLAWLNEVTIHLAPEQVRIVDESTAAALGYAVIEPDAVVLVFDFGGGTLDVSLVQLPESREKTGGILQRLRRKSPGQHTARVIAKVGRAIGGSDIDQWLLNEVMKRTSLTTELLGKDYTPLLTLCEGAKISLSSAAKTELTFEAAGQTHQLTLTRAELETLLEENGFYTTLRRVIDKVMVTARQRGIFREDINYVLLVGGTSLMPSVQQVLKHYFSDLAVRADKPFTAVVEGALQVAAGLGLEDYLVHGYGLRHLDSLTGSHLYEEIIPMGTRYPLDKPVEILLGAAHPDQKEIEFVIGEINADAISTVEVTYEAGQTVFVTEANDYAHQIIPLNEAQVEQALAQLQPPGLPGQDRLKALFTVDAQRRLRLTVVDLQTNQTLLENVVLASLR